MKKNKLFAAVCALGASAMLVFSCITFTQVLFPDEVFAGDEFEVTSTIDLDVTSADPEGTFLLGVYLPKSWNAGENITATYSTTGLDKVNKQDPPQKDVTDEAMKVVTDLKEPTTDALYQDALVKKYGNLENDAQMEWVILQGTTIAHLKGGDANAQGGPRPNDVVNIVVKLKLKAGAEEMSFNTALFTCFAEQGFKTNAIGYNPDLHGPSPDEYQISETNTVTVKAKPDYSSAVEVSPAGVSAGDYICISFDAAETPLKGAEVTLVATATLADGSTKTADAVKMEKQSGDKFFKYIYPKSLFGADNIKGIKVNFKAGETVVTSVDEEGFVVL